jgi:hypothetical protein
MIGTWRSPVLALVVVLGAGGAALAQPATPMPDASVPARVQIGPVGFRPSLILREVGYDSNVLNEETGDQGDFTATMGARLDVGARIARLAATYNTFYEYLYFKELSDERGSNRGAEGRVDLLLGRLRPHLVLGVRSSHDRPSAEIDARALRQLTSVGFGLAAVAMSRTTLSVAYRRNGTEYAADETFRGVPLADELNQRAHAITYGADFELSPLTTIAVHGEELRERFTLSPDRNANSHRYGVTALLNPLALISGRATLGVAAFRPSNPLEPDFTGLIAAINVGYAFPGESRVAVTIDRDVRHSYLSDTPYYVATGIRATYTRRLIRNIDGEITAGRDRVAYAVRLDAVDPTSGPDRVSLVGAGLATRLSDQARVGINFDYTIRSSPVASREYSRGRVLSTVTYGF